MAAPSSVDEVFERKALEVKAMYDQFLTALHEFASFNEVPKQTYILLKKKSAFAGIYPRKTYFNLEFLVNYPLVHPRLVKELKLSTHRYAYTVKIESEADLDEQLLKWLKDAYAVCK